MAYLICSNDNIYKIAADENEKNQHNVFFPPYEAVEVSNENFLKLKKNLVFATISNGNVNLTNLEMISFTETELQEYLKAIKTKLKSFLKIQKNHSKSIKTQIQNYYDYLNTFNTSTITYPLNKSWEQYCEENSINYLHPLQIP